MSKLWRRVLHYSLSFELRAELYCELDRAARAGLPLPQGVRKGVWKEPHRYDDYIRFLRFLDPRKKHHAIDAGANVGNWTADFLRFFPLSAVTCLEPVPATFAKLKARFEGDPRVRPVNAAASSTPGTAPMIVDEFSERSSLHQYDSSQEALNIKIKQQVDVQLARIDSLEIDAGAEMRLLKVDVQGHEIEAITGAAGLLPRIDVVIAELAFNVEYKGLAPSFSAFCRAMEDAGLFPFHFRNYGRSLSPYAWERDVIFVRQPLLERLWGW